MNYSKHVLLPCANCGSPDVRLARSITERHTPAWYIECIDCGMRTASYSDDCDADTAYDAVMKATDAAIDCCISVWNARVGKACCDDSNGTRNTCNDDHDCNESLDHLTMNYFKDAMDNFNHLYDIVSASRNSNK